MYIYIYAVDVIAIKLHNTAVKMHYYFECITILTITCHNKVKLWHNINEKISVLITKTFILVQHKDVCYLYI
jgi:hypothetical protein